MSMENIRILFTETSEFMSNKVNDILAEKHGIYVETANTENSANEILKNQNIDCIVMNTHLLKNGSLKYTETVENDIPIILFTSNSIEAEATKNDSDKITAYVSKNQQAEDHMTILANRIRLAIDAYEHRNGCN